MTLPRARALMAAVAAVLLGACGLLEPGAADQGAENALAVGTCFDEGPDGARTVEAVVLVDCEESHGFEVFHQLALPGEEYPGAEAVQVAADEACRAQFQPYVGTEPEESELDVVTLVPDEAAWDDPDGDPQVRCALQDDTGMPMEGSAKGIAR